MKKIDILERLFDRYGETNTIRLIAFSGAGACVGAMIWLATLNTSYSKGEIK